MEFKVLNDSPDFGNTEEFEGKWVQTPKSTVAGKAPQPSRSRHCRNLSLMININEPKYNQNKFCFDHMNARTRKRKGFKSNVERRHWIGSSRVPKFQCSKKPGFEIDIENNISNLKIALGSANRGKKHARPFVPKSKTDG